MRKIPTLFVRDFSRDNGRYVLPDVTPGCEWVMRGEGRATRKWDGTCVMIDEAGFLWARREVKPGKEPPSGWWELEADDTTGKRVGYEPTGQSSYGKILVALIESGALDDLGAGTYELVGPKVNGNPDGFEHHTLVPHGGEGFILDRTHLTFDGIRAAVLAHPNAEGIVWHHPDGRMAKIKRRDFRESS